MDTKKYEKYIGRSVKLEDGSRVKIKTLVHSFAYPNKIVVNEDHFVHYLDFFGQMNGEKISKQDIEDFDQSIQQEKDLYETKIQN